MPVSARDSQSPNLKDCDSARDSDSPAESAPGLKLPESSDCRRWRRTRRHWHWQPERIAGGYYSLAGYTLAHTLPVHWQWHTNAKLSVEYYYVYTSSSGVRHLTLREALAGCQCVCSISRLAGL